MFELREAWVDINTPPFETYTPDRFMLHNRTVPPRRLQIELIHGFDRERARRMRRFNRILNVLRDATNYGNNELVNSYVVDGEYRTASIFSSGVNNFPSYSIDVIALYAQMRLISSTTPCGSHFYCLLMLSFDIQFRLRIYSTG